MQEQNGIVIAVQAPTCCESNNYTSHSGIVIGHFNETAGEYSSVSGSGYNIASEKYSSVSAGNYNKASGQSNY